MRSSLFTVLLMSLFTSSSLLPSRLCACGGRLRGGGGGQGELDQAQLLVDWSARSSKMAMQARRASQWRVRCVQSRIGDSQRHVIAMYLASPPDVETMLSVDGEHADRLKRHAAGKGGAAGASVAQF
ncbi:hypothetical protein V8E36_009426 [Tilletia maclaganii]